MVIEALSPVDLIESELDRQGIERIESHEVLSQQSFQIFRIAR